MAFGYGKQKCADQIAAGHSFACSPDLNIILKQFHNGWFGGKEVGSTISGQDRWRNGIRIRI